MYKSKMTMVTQERKYAVQAEIHILDAEDAEEEPVEALPADDTVADAAADSDSKRQTSDQTRKSTRADHRRRYNKTALQYMTKEERRKYSQTEHTENAWNPYAVLTIFYPYNLLCGEVDVLILSGSHGATLNAVANFQENLARLYHGMPLAVYGPLMEELELDDEQERADTVKALMRTKVLGLLDFEPFGISSNHMKLTKWLFDCLHWNRCSLLITTSLSEQELRHAENADLAYLMGGLLRHAMIVTVPDIEL